MSTGLSNIGEKQEFSGAYAVFHVLSTAKLSSNTADRLAVWTPNSDETGLRFIATNHYTGV